MNCLVTGGAGFIGSVLDDRLIKDGHCVKVIDNESAKENEKFYWNEKAENYKYDICNYDQIYGLFKNVDFVFHLGAQSRIQPSIIDSSYTIKVNCHGTENVLHAAKENSVKKVVFSSSSSIYGLKNKLPHREEMSRDCLNPYAISKVSGEDLCTMYNKLYDLKIVILRYFNVAGADPLMRSGLISKNPTHLIKITSEAAIKKRDKVIIFGNDYPTSDGTAIRDYIHVSDLADLHVRAAQYLTTKRESNVFNCGYGKGFSVKEVVDSANEINEFPIKFEFGQRRKGDAARLVADPSKIMKFLSWKPKYNDLKFIIKTSIEWETNFNLE